MRVIFTGKGTSGSWQCRGVQLGGEIGAVQAKAKDFTAYDLIVLVKRPAPGQIEAIKKSGKPWVWDVVDFYPQPACTKWSREKATAWVKAQIDAFCPNGVIWPNERMANDCSQGGRNLVLYHHHRPDLRPRPVEKDVRIVGYEGSPRYLGRWCKAIQKACKRRGWEFRTEGTPQDFDVCVAFRDDAFNGYAQKHWKSNVKLANCHATGTPFVGASECGYLETAAGGEVFCDSLKDIDAALDEAARNRADTCQSFLKAAYSVQDAAIELKAFLNTI